MILIEINGQRLTGFKQIRIEKSLDDLAGTFSFTAVAGTPFAFPVKVGYSCQIYIDTFPVITGYVEGIEGRSEQDSEDVIFSGRDRTADVVDSTIGTNLEIKAPISLIDITQKTLSSEGITGINVSTNVSNLQPFQTGELIDISGEIGKSLFDFIENYARMRQVLMTTDQQGNILFTRTPTTSTAISLIRKKNDINRINNIESSSWVINNSKRFNQYFYHSQANMSSLEDSLNLNASSIVSIISSATDSQIRKGRNFNAISEQSADTTNMKNRATWEGSVRKARALEYRPKIPGFYPPNSKSNIWQLNQLIKIIDDYADINATMLINKISFESDIEAGETTELTLVPKDSYTLDLEIASVDQKTNKVSDNFLDNQIQAKNTGTAK